MSHFETILLNQQSQVILEINLSLHVDSVNRIDKTSNCLHKLVIYLEGCLFFCGNNSNFHFLQSNGILWVTSNMVYKKNPAA